MKYQPYFSKFLNEKQQKRKAAYISKVITTFAAATLILGSAALVVSADEPDDPDDLFESSNNNQNANSIELDVGVYYFRRSNGEVFIFTVTEYGWYDLGGVTPSTEAAYIAYLERLARADGAIYLSAGVYYFQRADSDEVFMFTAPQDDWYDMDGASEANEQEYNDYIDSLRVTDKGFYVVNGDILYYEIGGVVYKVVIGDGANEIPAGLYVYPSGALESDKDAYDAYIDSLIVDGFRLNKGDPYYYWLNGNLVTAIADKEGLQWYKLPAEAILYTDGFENIFTVFSGEVWYYLDNGTLGILSEGAHYIKDLTIYPSEVAVGAVAGDYFKFDGKLYLILSDMRIPVGAEIISQNRVVVGNGTPQYFITADDEIFVIDDYETYILPDGAIKLPANRIHTNETVNPETFYYEIVGNPSVYTVTIRPGETFIFPENSNIIDDIYNNDRVIIDDFGDFYYQLDGQWYHIRIVDRSRIYILPEGSTNVTKTKPNVGDITTIGNNSAGSGTPLDDIFIKKTNLDRIPEEDVTASSWTKENSANDGNSKLGNGTVYLYMDANGKIGQSNLHNETSLGIPIGVYVRNGNQATITITGDYSIGLRWQGNNYHIAELNGAGIYNLGICTDAWLGTASIIPPGTLREPEPMDPHEIDDLDPINLDTLGSKNATTGDLENIELPDEFGELVVYQLQELLGNLTIYQLQELLGSLTTYQLQELLGSLSTYQLQELLGSLTIYQLQELLGSLTTYQLQELLGSLSEYQLQELLGSLTIYQLQELLGSLTIYQLQELLGSLTTYQLQELLGSLTIYQLQELLGSLTTYQLQELLGSLSTYQLQELLGSLSEYPLINNPDDLINYILTANPGILGGYPLADILGLLGLYNDPYITGILQPIIPDPEPPIINIPDFIFEDNFVADPIVFNPPVIENTTTVIEPIFTPIPLNDAPELDIPVEEVIEIEFTPIPLSPVTIEEVIEEPTEEPIEFEVSPIPLGVTAPQTSDNNNMIGILGGMFLALLGGITLKAKKRND